MKGLLKKSLAFILALTMVFGAAPLAGLVGLELPSLKDVFAEKAEAATYGVLTYIINNGEVTITACNSSASGELVIPSSIEGCPVTSIGAYAFSSCTRLTNVTISNSVKSIGADAFSSCTRLTNVTISNSVKSIGYSAFEYCTGLTSVTIPDSVTSIGEEVFYNCTGLSSVTIGNGVTSIGRDAFENCTGLTSITIGNGVTSIGKGVFDNTGIYNDSSNWENGVLYIGNYLIKADSTISEKYLIKLGTKALADYAFYNCTGLTSITIPDSVTSIGYAAFAGCSGLTSITIPDSVTSIGYAAFAGCSGLTSITIPDSVMSIGNFAFSGCTGLTSITIPDSVTSIGDNAFYNCAGLTSVTIPDSVTSIGEDVFSGCTGLTSVTIGNGVTSIGGKAFENCTSLTNITIPDSVTSIGDRAFYYCTGLTSVTIGNGVTSIGYYAFFYCTGLTSVTIGNGVTTIGNSAFYGCAGLTNVYYAGDIAGWCSVVFDGSSSNPMHYANNLYINGQKIEGELVIPNGVESIGNYAFYNCTGLTSITIPDSVMSIGNFAFYGCTGLTSITVDENNPNYSSDESGVLFNKDKTTLIQYRIGNKRTEYIIPDSVTSIGNYAFYNCTGLTSVTIPNSVTSIGKYAFEECTGLTSITIPGSVTSIGNCAFFGCTGLTSITIPDSVTNIGDYAFDDCTGLTSVIIGNGVTSIGEYAFYGCDKLTSIAIPDSVTSINRYAFAHCTGLTSVTIGNGVKRIGLKAFDYCCSITSVTFVENSDLTSIGDYAFSECKGLTSITIPDSVTSIGDCAFLYCTGLKSVTIPDSVTSIGYSAFNSCTGLTSVIIGNGVMSIGSYAFAHCTGLDKVYYLGSLEEWNVISIDNGNENLKNATIFYAKENGETKKESVSDEATDVGVEYFSNFYNGEVKLIVERTFDGKAFDIINIRLDVNTAEIYDIKITIDGVVTQPNGKVKVRIPIPTDYDPTKTFVYNINTNTGRVENMNAVVDGNYLVFETDRFSFYAVIEAKGSETDNPTKQNYKITWNNDGGITEQKYKAGDVITAPQNPIKSGYRFVGWSPAVPVTMPACDLIFTAVFEKIETPIEDEIKVSIRNPSTTTINYGDSIILHADIDGTLPAGARIEWTADNGNFDMSVSADGTTCKISPKSNGKTVFTVTAYDKDGNVVSSDTQEMTAKAGFFDKIVAFFKKIFGLTKTFPEAFKGIF